MCIRLSTYEDSEEAKFLRKVYGGEIANTVFAILTPDAKTKLSRASRGPRFRGSGAMTEFLKETIASSYPEAPRARWSDPSLPEIKNLELALNVASCDYTPVILAVAKSGERLEELRSQLLKVAWDQQLAGQFAFASSSGGSELRAVQGIGDQEGLFVLAPDAYGLSAKILLKFDDVPSASEELLKIATDYEPGEKNHGSHVRMGVALGLKWNTEIPVTDMQFVRATERLWGEEYVHQPSKIQQSKTQAPKSTAKDAKKEEE